MPEPEFVFTVDRRMKRRVHRAARGERRDVAGRLQIVLNLLGHQPDDQRGFFGIRLAEHRRARHGASRVHVFLHQHRRHGQHVADVVEAVARVVHRKFVGRPERDAKEVANRVVVLCAVQPPGRDASRIDVHHGMSCRTGIGPLDPPSDRGSLLRRQRRQGTWRHRPRLELVDYL